jgi:outer membrane protein, multidrug efflux system
MLSLIALSACTAGPNYNRPDGTALKVPSAYRSLTAAPPTAVELTNWWGSFNDPLLSDLIGRALGSNNDVAAATARLQQARASLTGARGALLPSVGASASAADRESLTGGNGSSDSYQLGIDASWEADIFGANKRGVEVARAGALGAQATLHDIQRAIAAELALNYIEARNTQARLKVARTNLGYQDETVQIAGWRYQAGLVSALDVEQARVLRAQTASSIPQLESSYANITNRIAVLTGEAPGAVTPLLDSVQKIPLGPDAVEAGLPAALLERRPDLIAAEANLAGEVARIGIAEAQLYPALRLTGSLNSNALSVGGLGTSIIGNLVGGVTAPIFQGGQIRAQIAGQKASADAALATYRGSVLRALEDVENALVALDKAKTREGQLILAENAARNAERYARTRYQAGLIDFQSLLEAQRSLLNAEDARTIARAGRATANVQLYKALGGGWSPGEAFSVRP